MTDRGTPTPAGNGETLRKPVLTNTTASDGITFCEQLNITIAANTARNQQLCALREKIQSMPDGVAFANAVANTLLGY